MNVTTEQKMENDSETRKTDFKESIVNIVYILKPLYFVQRCFGITAFRMVDGEIRPIDWKTKILGSLSLLAYCVLLFYSCAIFILSIPSKNSTIGVISFFLPNFITFFEYLISAITILFSTDTVNMFFITFFAELDTLFSLKKICDFYEKSHAETIKYLIGFFVMISINTTVFFITSENNSDLMPILLIPIEYFQKFQILVFCRVVLMLRTRLMLINDYITTFIQNQDINHVNMFAIQNRKGNIKRNFDFIGRVSNSNTKIRDLATMYDLIGKICQKVNQAWNFQIFMTL